MRGTSPVSTGKASEKEPIPSPGSSEPGAQETLVGPLPLVLTSLAWSCPPASHHTMLSDFSETLADCAEQEGRKGEGSGGEVREGLLRLLDGHTRERTRAPTRWGRGDWEVETPLPCLLPAHIGEAAAWPPRRSQRLPQDASSGRGERAALPGETAGREGWRGNRRRGCRGREGGRGRGCRWSGRAPEGGAQSPCWPSPALWRRVSGFQFHPFARLELG